LLADLATLEKQKDKATRTAKAGRKEDQLILKAIEKAYAHVDASQPIRTLALAEGEQPVIDDLHLITAKPVLYIANVGDQADIDNERVKIVQAIAADEGAEAVALCAQIEAELMQLDDDERDAFLQELEIDEPGLHKVIRAAYHLLGLQTYFTAGPKEVRAWTVKVGATAPQAAAAIHTDFERGFIRAEVVNFDDYVIAEGEHGAKESGKLRLEGKEYTVQDGDVIHFRFNV
ncbi:MAG: redox-regulated ATPase YchF, partial [Gammaproteobacteria bacterium]|nr:redox-regulated ATPase YchF [Gammaproteobacteria bacterium]